MGSNPAGWQRTADPKSRLPPLENLLRKTSANTPPGSPRGTSPTPFSAGRILLLVKKATTGIAAQSSVEYSSVDGLEKRADIIKSLISGLEATQPTHSAIPTLKAIHTEIVQKSLYLVNILSTIAAIENSRTVIDTNFKDKPLLSDSAVGSPRPGSPARKQRPSIRDFEIIKPISRGSFGQVVLGRKKATGDVYAIKVLKKSSVNNKNKQEYISNERNILAFTDNPFVVKLYYSFQSVNNLYMVMEYLPGGDCFSLLKSLIAFPEKLTRQYIAETVLALEYLHKNGIVHRDLKPDNMLITREGHIKLTDFGLSKMGLMDKQENLFEWRKKSGANLMETSSTLDEGAVGTPDYIAPEVFLSTGSGPEVDWWSVGCMTYEFLVGITPFYADTCEEVFENIMNNNILWPEPPDELSPNARDFISQLLKTDPAERLGANGASEVKAHPFFSGIDWDNLLTQPGAFIPTVNGMDDTGYFEPRKGIYDAAWEGDAEAEQATSHEGDRQSGRFRNFSFVNVAHLGNSNLNIAKQTK